MERSESQGGCIVPTRWRVLAILILMTAVATVWSLTPWQDTRRPEKMSEFVIPPPASSPYKNTRPGVAFVGDKDCARCHAEIAESFHQHPMGRSMATPVEVMPGVNGLVFEVNDLAYSIEHRDGRVFHQETRKGGSGGVLARTEAEVRYVMGSGRRGYSFLVEREGGLFQSPIAWYTQGQKWDLAPGYRGRNQHFGRPITQQCLFCHTNRFDISDGQPPIFHGLTIGCERCHGPGELHSRRPESVAGKDLTIVNPVNLKPPALRENVCEQCHFQGTSRIDQAGHSLFDYRPGLPLEDFVFISFRRANPARGIRAVGHVEQMRESRCYRDSGGELGCTSCHDPHRLPEPAARVAYYRNRCLECHLEHGCSLPRDARLARQPEDDCVACHMPQSPDTNVAHTALTDHMIPRDAGLMR
jgi:hypothetical protein